MPWTNVSKPGAQTYTNLNPMGKEQYDQPDLTYDSSSTFYDGVNPDMWTGVARVPDAWDISKAVLTKTFDFTGQTGTVEWTAFKENGLQLYLGDGNNGTFVYQYELAMPWDISSVTFQQQKDFGVILPDYVESAAFSPTGDYLFLLRAGIPAFIEQYRMTTPWDISTAALLQAKNLTGVSRTGLFLKPDGLSLYVTNSATDSIEQYSLSEPFDVSTLSLLASTSISAQTTNPDGLFIGDSGSKLYLCNFSSTSRVFEYGLATPWDITTLSFIQSFTISQSSVGFFGASFSSDGTKFFGPNNSTQLLNQYNLTPQWVNVSKPT